MKPPFEEIIAPATDSPRRSKAADPLPVSPDLGNVALPIPYAIEQPGDVDVGEIVVRPAAQG